MCKVNHSIFYKRLNSKISIDSVYKSNEKMCRYDIEHHYQY